MTIIVFNKKEKSQIKISDYEEKETLAVIDNLIKEKKILDFIIVGRKLTTITNLSKKRLKEMSVEFNFEIRTMDRFLLDVFFLIKRAIDEKNYSTIVNEMFTIVNKVQEEIKRTNKINFKSKKEIFKKIKSNYKKLSNQELMELFSLVDFDDLKTFMITKMEKETFDFDNNLSVAWMEYMNLHTPNMRAD